MIGENKILAIIPARGGSKGIPNKNIKLINGKPLIAHTIEEAIRSKYIDKIIVSTDDAEIAKISRQYGAEIPFMRPPHLAKDDTPGIEPIIHALNWFKSNNQEFDYVICLQCTSPFRKVEQVDEALEKLMKSNSDSIVSVCESEVSPYWMKKIENGEMKDFLNDIPFYGRRQDTPKIYRLNGAIYISNIETLSKNKSWYSENTLAYIMDRESSIDIDDMIDFKFAEFLMKEREHAK